MKSGSKVKCLTDAAEDMNLKAICTYYAPAAFTHQYYLHDLAMCPICGGELTNALNKSHVLNNYMCLKGRHHVVVVHTLHGLYTSWTT